MASIEERFGVYDVLVAGGGMAGIAAAIAAARQGAKTLLVEQAGWLGGIGITGATALHNFFNIYGAHPGAERLKVVGGVGQELVDRTVALGGSMGHVEMERGGGFVSMATIVDPEAFRLAAFQLCEEAGANLLLHTAVEEAFTTGRHLDKVMVWNKAGRSAIRAKHFIDCTGDGDLAAYAGAEVVRFAADDPGAYHAGFTFRLCNLDLEALEADLESRGMIWHVAHAVKPGANQPDLVRVGLDTQKMAEAFGEPKLWYFFATSVRPREFTYVNCINYGPNDGLDAVALTRAEVDLRARMFEVADLFRRNVRGAENCYPAGSAPTIGQRRARAIKCEYDLTQEDCTEGRKFEDKVGCFSFIDNNRYFVKEAGWYDLPYRALRPKGLDNVLIAGRMMSVDTVAHNSTRNTAFCLVCGQAAGTAAALAARQELGTQEVDVEELQSCLLKEKALLAGIPC